MHRTQDVYRLPLGGRRWRLVASATVLLLCSSSFIRTTNAGPTVYPTGVTIYDPARAYSSYLLFGDHSPYVSAGGAASAKAEQATREGDSRLIDMNGNVIREWSFGGYPTEMLDPKLMGGKRGVIGVQLSKVTKDETTHRQVPGQPTIFTNKEIGLVDWNNEIVWRAGTKVPPGALYQHHGWDRLPNGNTLVLGQIRHAVPGYKEAEIDDDIIYELNTDGNPVWTWVASDHMNDLGFSEAQQNMIRTTPFLTPLELQSLKSVGPNKWFNAGDQRFAPENILISSRNANFIVILDHKTGKIVWQIGPNYPERNLLFKADVVPQPVNQIAGPHDVHMIPEGLPGAGNIMVFDNQSPSGFPPVSLSPVGGSRVLEIDPIKKEIVWQYSARNSHLPDWRFYSSFSGSARRLPNGNTLVDEATQGHAFQVTPDGDIVWEYVSPFLLPAAGAATGSRARLTANLLYMVQVIPYSWVPDGTPHSEKAVIPPEWGKFQVPQQP